MNKLHVELGHTLEAIIWATRKATDVNLTGIFKACEDCILGKARKAGISKLAIER